MTDINETPHQYIINLTPSQARTAQAVLQQAGILFEPMDDAVVMDTDNSSYWNMTADDLNNAIAAINRHLQVMGHQPPVPEPASLEQTLEALQLASTEFSWQNWHPDYESWQDRHTSWEETTGKYPNLFPPA